MSDLDPIVTINISGAVPQVSEPGFGTPMIAVCYTPNFGASVVRQYTSLAAVQADFPTTAPAYQIAEVLFAANPAPQTVKIGRRAHAFTQVVHLWPAAPSGVAGQVYGVLVDGLLATYTTSTADTTNAVCVGLAAAINALTAAPSPTTQSPYAPPTAVATPGSGASTHIVCTGAAGVLHSYAFPASTPSTTYQSVQIEDATTDPGIQTDLAAIQAADADWYFLLLDSNSAAEIGSPSDGGSGAAGWMDGQGFGMLVTQTADTGDPAGDVLDPTSTTDVMYVLFAANTQRTFIFYTPGIATAWPAAGIVASRCTATPGSDTWWGKTLADVPSYGLTTTQKNAVLVGGSPPSKRGNTYTIIAGVAIVQNGTMANGTFADMVRFLDWLKQSIQIAIFTLLIANDGKVPYTDGGASLIAAAVLSVLKAGVKAGGLNPGAPAGTDNTGTPYAAIAPPSVYAPPVASVPTATRLARQYPGVTFSAQGAGAMQGVTIQGSVS